MIVVGAAVAAFVTERTGYQFRGPHATIGYERAGKIVAGLVFTNWSGADIEITGAGDVLPRALLRAAAGYVFDQLGCIRATFKTPRDHTRAIRADKRLGARFEGRQRNFFGPGRDALIFGILREEYPYGP